MAESAGLAIASVIDKVSFVNKLPILAQATEDNGNPTPGYLYKEINNITYGSGTYCQDLLTYLVERLTKKSVHVKVKTIRLMKYIVENGHPEFKQGLRRKSSGIKEATQCSGPPDPLHGMALYAMVRKEAQELSHILFDISKDDGQVPEPMPAHMKNFGGMGNNSQGRMEGFGNQPVNMVKRKGLGESILDSIVDIADKVLDPGPALPMASLTTEKRFGNYRPVKIPDDDQLPTSQDSKTLNIGPPVTSMISSTYSDSEGYSIVKGHTIGKAAGGWDDDDEEGDDGARTCVLNEQNKDIPGVRKTTSSTLSTDSTSLVERMDSVKIQDCKLEKDLVCEYAAKFSSSYPTRADISIFIKKSSVLNCDQVVESIKDMLMKSSTPDIGHVGLLLAVEGLMRTDYVTYDHLARVLQTPLISFYKGEQGPLKQKARKIIRILERLSKQSQLFTDIAEVRPPGMTVSNHRSYKLPPKNLHSGLTENENNLAFLNVPFATHSQYRIIEPDLPALSPVD